MPLHNVVITGIGPVGAFGLGADALSSALQADTSLAQPATKNAGLGLSTDLACEIPADSFNIRDVVPKSHRKAIKVMCPDIESALAATDSAIRHAELRTTTTHPDETPIPDPLRLGCQLGAGLIAADVEELGGAMTVAAPDGVVDVQRWGSEGMERLTPLWMLKYLPNMPACHVTIVHGAQGPSNTMTCGETGSMLAITEAARVVERGDADACLAGGTEDRIHPVQRLRQHLSERLGKGVPFKDTGAVPGEGGAVLIVESLEHATARNATILARVTGIAGGQSPHCTRDGGVPKDDPSFTSVMERAMEDAGVSAQDIDEVITSASGVHSDHAEQYAIASILGWSAQDTRITTPAKIFGNCGAGLGALVASSAVLRISQGQAKRVLAFVTGQGGQHAALVLEASA